MKMLFREKFQVTKRISCADTISLNGRQWCRRWDKGAASIFGLIALATLVAIVLYNVFVRCPDCDSSCNNKDGLRSVSAEPKCKSLNNICDLQCMDVHEDELGEHINLLLNGEKCKDGLSLTLKEIIFNNYELQNGWLNTIQPNVIKLNLDSCNIDGIQEKAFAGHPFDDLRTLWFVEPSITTLKRHSFLGLNNLEEFAMHSNKYVRKIHAEARALEGMSSTLSILQLEGFIFEPDCLINITGTNASLLPKIVQVVLRNSLITVLENNLFAKAASARAIYLDGCGIETIHADTFAGLTQLTLLHLNQNALETLPEGVFGNLNTLKPGGLYLGGGNPWVCSCELEWLRLYYQETDYVNKNSGKQPICYLSSGDFEGTESFCKPAVTTTSSSTTSNLPSSPSSPTTTITTTTEQHGRPSELTIRCKKINPEAENRTHAKENSEDLLVAVEESVPVNLTFKQVEDEGFYVEVTAAGDVGDYHLLWFPEEDKSQIKCATPLPYYMKIHGLDREVTYIFSLLHYNKKTVSPKNCFSFRTLPEWQDMTWLTNKYKTMIISVVATSILVLILVTTFITFVCIRRFPKLIKGNKNVIIVKPGRVSETASSTCKDYEKPPNWEHYCRAISTSGYLTPTYHRYTRVRYRPPLVRSVSECNSNYTEPRPLQQILELPQLRNQPVCVEVEDYRPPLPPPNPGKSISERTTKEAEDETIYTCIEKF